MSHSTTGNQGFKLSFLTSRTETEERAIYGTPEQLVENFQERADAGRQHFKLRFADFPNTDGIELFAKEVRPHFR